MEMTRLVSIVVVYPADADFGGLFDTLEREFLTKLELGEHRRVGGARARIIDVRVPDGFALYVVQRRLEDALPTVAIRMLERFPGSWWARHRWGIAIGIGVGLAVALIVELLRPLAARLRELLG